jgi:hypothetical protein
MRGALATLVATALVGEVKRSRPHPRGAESPGDEPHAQPSPSAGTPSAGTPSAGLPSAGLPSAGLPSAGLPSAGLPSAGLPSAARFHAGGYLDVALEGGTLRIVGALTLWLETDADLDEDPRVAPVPPGGAWCAFAVVDDETGHVFAAWLDDVVPPPDVISRDPADAELIPLDLSLPIGPAGSHPAVADGSKRIKLCIGYGVSTAAYGPTTNAMYAAPASNGSNSAATIARTIGSDRLN